MIGELERQLEADLETFAVPGASWALIDGGRVVHHGGVGRAAADREGEVTPQTLFQACSISKPIAAVAMLRLVEQGLLDLDEDVNEKLTSWRVPPTADWQPVVTLRQLVSHSAGLTTSGFPGYSRGAELPTTIQILEGISPANTFGVRVDTVPGTQFRYSGGGTMVMQQLLEDVTGTPFRLLVRELVLEPLGMSDSDYAQPLPEELEGRAATAHDEAGRPIEGRWHTYPEHAAAGLWTTPGDLATFAVAVQQAYAGRDGAILAPESARELLTPQIPAEDRIGGLDRLGLGPFLGGTEDGVQVRSLGWQRGVPLSPRRLSGHRSGRVRDDERRQRRLARAEDPRGHRSGVRLAGVPAGAGRAGRPGRRSARPLRGELPVARARRDGQLRWRASARRLPGPVVDRVHALCSRQLRRQDGRYTAAVRPLGQRHDDGRRPERRGARLPAARRDSPFGVIGDGAPPPITPACSHHALFISPTAIRAS